MNTTQYAINAGLYGEFYVIRQTEDGKLTVVGSSFPTFLAAGEWIESI